MLLATTEQQLHASPLAALQGGRPPPAPTRPPPGHIPDEAGCRPAVRVLTIQPHAVGWSLSISGVPNAMQFQSGAAAEAAARRLGARLASHGEAAKLIVRLRDGSIGGRFLYPPAATKLGWAA